MSLIAPELPDSQVHTYTCPSIPIPTTRPTTPIGGNVRDTLAGIDFEARQAVKPYVSSIESLTNSLACFLQLSLELWIRRKT